MIRTFVKFAVFTLVCLAFTGYLAMTIGNIRLFEDTYSLTARFDDVTGLLPNDNVKVAGVVVGKVSDVKIDKGQAVVTFSVRDNVKVPTDTAAGIRWRNLLGQRYVYLYPGSASTTLEDGDTVEETTSVVDLGELFNRLGPIVAAIDPAQVNAFLDAIVEGLDGNQDKVRQVLDDLAVLMSGLATRDEAIGQLVENLNDVTGTITARDAQIRTVLDNLVTLSSTFSANTDIVDAAVTDLGSVSENLDQLLSTRGGEIDRILANLLDVLNTVEGRLGTVDRAVGTLDEAVIKVFAAGRYGEFLNQVIPCAGMERWSGTTPPCAGAITGLGTVGNVVPPGTTSGGGASGPAAPTAPAGAADAGPPQTEGAAAVEELLDRLVGS